MTARRCTYERTCTENKEKDKSKSYSKTDSDTCGTLSDDEQGDGGSHCSTIIEEIRKHNYNSVTELVAKSMLVIVVIVTFTTLSGYANPGNKASDDRTTTFEKPLSMAEREHLVPWKPCKVIPDYMTFINKNMNECVYSLVECDDMAINKLSVGCIVHMCTPSNCGTNGEDPCIGDATTTYPENKEIASKNDEDDSANLDEATKKVYDVINGFYKSKTDTKLKFKFYTPEQLQQQPDSKFIVDIPKKDTPPPQNIKGTLDHRLSTGREDGIWCRCAVVGDTYEPQRTKKSYFIKYNQSMDKVGGTSSSENRDIIKGHIMSKDPDFMKARNMYTDDLIPWTQCFMKTHGMVPMLDPKSAKCVYVADPNYKNTEETVPSEKVSREGERERSLTRTITAAYQYVNKRIGFDDDDMIYATMATVSAFPVALSVYSSICAAMSIKLISPLFGDWKSDDQSTVFTTILMTILAVPVRNSTYIYMKQAKQRGLYQLKMFPMICFAVGKFSVLMSLVSFASAAGHLGILICTIALKFITSRKPFKTQCDIMSCMIYRIVYRIKKAGYRIRIRSHRINRLFKHTVGRCIKYIGARYLYTGKSRSRSNRCITCKKVVTEGCVGREECKLCGWKFCSRECKDNNKVHTRKCKLCACCGTKRGTKVCSRCMTARYCSKECHTAHWPIHEIECIRLEAERTCGKNDTGMPQDTNKNE